MTWQVFMNGKFIGIEESNYPWASKYWASRNTKERRFTLRSKS